jgi:hypothetical protein
MTCAAGRSPKIWDWMGADVLAVEGAELRIGLLDML